LEADLYEVKNNMMEHGEVVREGGRQEGRGKRKINSSSYHDNIVLTPLSPSLPPSLPPSRSCPPRLHTHITLTPSLPPSLPPSLSPSRSCPPCRRRSNAAPSCPWSRPPTTGCMTTVRRLPALPPSLPPYLPLFLLGRCNASTPVRALLLSAAAHVASLTPSLPPSFFFGVAPF